MQNKLKKITSCTLNDVLNADENSVLQVVAS